MVVRTARFIVTAAFWGGFMLSAGTPLVGNGSFEGERLPGIPNWSGKGNFWRGRGECFVTDREAFDGKHSLQLKAAEPDSRGQSSTELFTLVPDRKYRVSYCIKRDNEQVDGHLSLEFSAADKKGSFVCHPTAAAKKRSLNAWLTVGGENLNILFFLPAGSSRQYVVLKNGIFSVPSELYGKAPVQCRAKLYVSGVGNVYMDKVVIETADDKRPEQEKSIGFAAAEQDDAAILLLDVQKKSNQVRSAAAEQPEKFKLELPPEFDASPIPPPDLSRYPAAIRNTKFVRARIERDGKPVFLIGAEGLSPFLCKMFGIDFWVNSAFGNRVEAVQQGDTIKTRLTNLPFLEEHIREHLRSGILVWLDLLQDYKVWHSKLLLENFPGLFVTREGFFCWRPEEPRAQFLRHATWFNAVEKARKYPIFVYELFNEVCYEDHSPYNYRQFRREMAEKYGTIERANAKWGTSFRSFDAVVPPGGGRLTEIVNGVSPQLKADWSWFTERRFAAIAGESVAWLHKVVPGARATLQSYNGLPFDFQNNFVNPFLVNPQLDLTAAEFDGKIYPQWEGAENEAEIVSSMRRDMDVSLTRLSAPEQVVIDGECRIGPEAKSATKENIVIDLNGKWLFRPGVLEAEENMKFTGYDVAGNVEDAGRREGWQKVALDTAGWTPVDVPGMWGKQGFRNCSVGWYRRAFRVPAGARRLYLSGQKLSDRGDIYLNGELIHQTLAWNEPFSIDISDKVNRTGENVIAIRIFNRYFQDGYFFGGIRDRLYITNLSLKAVPVTPEQLAFFFSLRALQGYSGLCWSYFYINWMEDWPSSIFNPEKFTPATLAALPEIKTRINDLGNLIFWEKHQPRTIGVTYSLSSARSYIPKDPNIPNERSNDIARYYSGSVFSHRGTDVVSDDVLNDYSKMRRYRALILCLTEAVSEQGMKNLRKFAEEGGLLIVDRKSLTKSAFDGSPIDASGLLGVVRGPSAAEPLHEIEVRGVAGRMSTVSPRLADAGQYAALQLVDAEPFARAGKLVVGAVRKLGKGKIITFAAELSAGDFAALYRTLFQKAGIPPELKVEGGKYVELFTRQKDGKLLWSIFNRGKDAQLRISGRVPAGSYLVREAFSGRELFSPAGRKFWSASELEAGVTLTARNLTPVHLLIEPEKSEKIAFTSVPAEQREALQKFFLPLWDDLKNPRKRVLWYGYTPYAPPMVPSAVKVMREMGIAVDFMADSSFSPELKVLRGGKKIVAKLNSYDLLVIPRSRAKLGDSECRGLEAYLKQGGNILLLANHVYNMHSYYNRRMPGILKVLGAGVVDAAIEDPANSRLGEARRFNTRNVLPHKVMDGVRVFAAMGATTVSLAGGETVLSAEDSAQITGRNRAMLVLKDTGGNRIAVCGDTEWLTPEGLCLADNAKLWSNLVGWLCNLEPLPENVVRQSVSLPEF